MLKKYMKTISAAALAAGIVFATGAAPATAVLADELTQFDQTKIEDDLKDVDLTIYGKDENGRHQLIDGSGFMEYAYSSDATVAGDYFGIYFYVYNPTEREVSTRAGANVVNMAVAYDAEGEPTEYANCALTVLDYTNNHRFYKFKLTNSAGAYDRAKAYASAHEGVRRYDIAGIQLWFAGDANATDEFPLNTERGVTYRCKRSPDVLPHEKYQPKWRKSRQSSHKRIFLNPEKLHAKIWGPVLRKMRMGRAQNNADSCYE